MNIKFLNPNQLLVVSKVAFILLLILSPFVSPAVALFSGILFAIIIGNPYGKLAKKGSKYLLQFAVVGLGFGMNLHSALAAGRDGILFTIVSVVGVIAIGSLLGRYFKLMPRLSYLISTGTAICGGSAIAAVSPIVRANDDETSMSLAVVFTLNAIALFIFPPIGHLLGMDQAQFGMWAAIAIHDTSSVVGAASIYGEEALNIATTIKLTRALWIIPLSLVSIFIFSKSNKDSESDGGKKGIYMPWFILFFILAMLVNTYFPLSESLSSAIKLVSRKSLSITLYLIGCGLSLNAVKQVGIRPVLFGIALWLIISVMTLVVVL